MTTLGKSTVVKHPKGGGTLHVPQAVMKYFQLEPGNIMVWIISRPDEKEEFVDIGLKILVQKT